MFDNLSKYAIVLASNSPRRKELMQRLGIDFTVRNLLGVDESYPDTLKGDAIARYISEKKAEAYRTTMAANELLITADTIVCTPDGKVLGKPLDAQEAHEMLHRLSGITHQVITGVTVLTAEKKATIAVSTSVTFAQLTEEEIDYYIDNYLPFDKAGAYGIQEWIGLVAVEGIQGSFFNVMGLPIQKLYSLLKTF